MESETKQAIAVTCIFLASICMVTYGACKHAEYKCTELSRLMQVESNFNASYGCLVKHKGNWIPLSQVRMSIEPWSTHHCPRKV